MDHDYIYSIRMRASAGNRHISGAERIVSPMKLDATVQALIARARGKKTPPEQIVITIEHLGNLPISKLTALDVVTVNAPDMSAGRSAASRILQLQGVSDKSVRSAFNLLSNGGASFDLNMRGAMIHRCRQWRTAGTRSCAWYQGIEIRLD